MIEKATAQPERLQETTSKKRYSTPRILSVEMIEAIANVCEPGPLPGTGGKIDDIECETATS